MKLNVEKKFVDRITNEVREVGDVITVDDVRGKELLADSRKLVSLNVEETVNKSSKKRVTK